MSSTSVFVNEKYFQIPSGVSPEEAVRIFVQFSRIESAIKAVVDLHNRYFGGRTVKCMFYPSEKFEALDLAPQPDELANPPS